MCVCVCVCVYVTLQEKEKTYFTFNVSQWNQNFFPSNFGQVFWSIHQEIYTQCKNMSKTEKTIKMESQIGRAHV